MTIRRSRRNLWKFRNRKVRQKEHRRERARRELRLEPLEDRRLLAIGPQVAGIQPNEGDLLRDGQTLNIAPTDLTIRFTKDIDAATFDGIRVTRSGKDGQFVHAHAATDFNTDGAVIVDFEAVAVGRSGDGVAVNVIKNALGTNEGPRITVRDEVIQVELNTTPGSETRAIDLVNAINQDPDASHLVRASVRGNINRSANITAPPITYSPIVLAGSSTASVRTNFNAGRQLELEFLAAVPGSAGRGVEIVVTKQDMGGVSPPRVTVQDRTVFLELNSNSAAPTTAGEVVTAINSDPDASALVTVRQPVGSSSVVVGNRVINFSPLRLNTLDDEFIDPGFLGFGNSPREVVFRFSEPLPDDVYHVEVLGTGPDAVRDVSGLAVGDLTEDGVDNGVDVGVTFNLDLAPQVLSVVAQPVTRNSVTNLLSQARDQVRVYFNDDDLFDRRISTGQLTPDPSVVTPDFYQLIFTNDTVQNQDDVVYTPEAVQYDPASDVAVLFFDEPLEGLGSGTGTFRLRIGAVDMTGQVPALPLPPVESVVSAASSSSDFGTAGAVEMAFTATGDFAQAVKLEVRTRDFGGPSDPVVSVSGQRVVVELNTNAGNETTADDLAAAINGDALASTLVTASVVAGDGSTDIASGAVDGTVLTLVGAGSSFDTATDLGVIDHQSQILSSQIDVQAYDLPFPGEIAEPGHRDLRPEVQRHYLDDSGDTESGITTVFYNFQDIYGFDPDGNPLHNAITELQKQRTREIFSLYSQYLGIQFIETANQGMTIVTGDLRAVDPQVTTGPGGVIGIAGGGLTGVAVMDLQDFSNPGDDQYGGAWFLTAMHEIGHLLGMGHTTELAPLTIMADEPALAFPENTVEPIFPGMNDIIHGQHLYRPESKDIDMFRFQLPQAGRLTLETMAERLSNPSQLDTVLALYRENAEGRRELIARNDDYFSNDSFLELDLKAGTYWIGISASGNDSYDPTVEDTGLGGRSQGPYDLRIHFTPEISTTITDATGIILDGDGDGVPGGAFNQWIPVQDAAHTLFVDKASAPGGTGSLAAPFNNIADALAVARAAGGEPYLIRILPNGGGDGNLATPEDNLAYEIGFNRLGNVLADGATLEVPKNVTVMIDAGAIVKLRRARIGVGSSSVNIDRSAGSLQVLGTPVLLDPFGGVLRDEQGEPIPGSVYFTSIHDDQLGEDTNPDTSPPPAAPGDWGGIVFRRDVDNSDENRTNLEDAGIFLDTVTLADVRYGGGIVVVDGTPQVINPIHLTDARPTIANSEIRFSADAAISATPDSFKETNFHAPADQLVAFTSDYSRVGPDIHGNGLSDNSINGLFVRVATPAGSQKLPLTVSARWDDADIPHVLTDRLVIQGNPGGLLSEAETPPVTLVALTDVEGGQLESGTYNYRVVFVDANGNEGAPSEPTGNVIIDAATGRQAVELNNLPQAPSGFVARHLYRSEKSGDPDGTYVLAARLNATATQFADVGQSLGSTLASSSPQKLRARLDARLAIDPGLVVKLNRGGFETSFGSELYAEGVEGRKVVFTSLHDQRYGGGGTFATSGATQIDAAGGDWGGIYVGPASGASLDHAVVAYGGGEMGVEGTFATFNALEVHQSDVRVAHSLFEQNAPGTGGQSDFTRVGRGFNRDAAIFVRGAQPVIVDNVIIDNAAPAISINATALDAQEIGDPGRSTYTGRSQARRPIDTVAVSSDNQGPLVRYNRLDRNEVNGLQVRGATLTTESVWDDTDIVHVLRNESVVVPDFHTFGGLRLESTNEESLVVKLEGPEAGFTATGRPLDIDDRIGGAVHVVGQPSHPVVMTSIEDCTVGAGFTPQGEPQNDTINSGACRLTTSTVPYADVIVVMDESGSMFFAQQFSAGMITDLENALVASGIGNGTVGTNQYGLVGFGGGTGHLNGHAHPVGPNGELFGSATDYVNATATLTDLGAIEDGYDAIQFALDTYPMRPDAEKFIILVTNEDRDILDPLLNFNTILAGLNAADVTLETILSVSIADSAGNQALAIDSNRTVFIEDGAGGFTTSPNGTISTFFFDTSITDYADLAFATGGLAGDINQIQAGGLTATSFSNAMVSQIVVQAGGGNRGRPGDWRSVRLEEYSHDRNIETLVESEAADEAVPGSNGTIEGSLPLGALAPHEKAGDERLRLGFEVHGALGAAGDVDVYRFTGTAGTEVWLDIDRTSTRLDTVVELLDASGQILARSDDSGAERDDPSLLFRSPQMPDGTVFPLAKAGYDPQHPDRDSLLQIPDRYTTNPRDAGLRVILPGELGGTNTYYVRVRSGNGQLGDPDQGTTIGRYQLQVRLRELDEVPGSTVQYADIRFATNAIEILGQPIHSPLLGEATETGTVDPATGLFIDSNDSIATAQNIGNLLQTDRGALSVAGDIALPDDVDVYQLTIEYDSVQGDGPRPHLSTIFDIDYADGLARPNTELWIFDSEGRLILKSNASNIADDQPGPIAGADMSDLSRGSAGPLDPFIGPVELPAGPDLLDADPAPPEREIYYVAVSSNAQMPDELRQYLDPNPPNPLVRLEPVNSVRRIAEDRIGVTFSDTTAEQPEVPVLLDPTASPVPFELGDVTLFVGTDFGLAPNTTSSVVTVDAFTGAQETTLGSLPEPIADIAMRGDGNLFAYSIGPDNFQGPINDTTVGTLVQIDTGTAASTKLSDDGVETYVQDPMNPGNPERAPAGQNNDGVGITYNAIAYRSTTDSQFFNGFVVGSRNDAGFNQDPETVARHGVEFVENILYHFDINNGVVANRSPSSQNRQQAAQLNGAGTQKIEFGEILTFTRIVPLNPEIGDTFTITINDKSISYTASGDPFLGIATPEEVVAGLAAEWVTAALTVPEFAAFQVLNSPGGFFAQAAELRVRLIDPAAAFFDIQTSTTDGGAGFGLSQDLIVEGFGPGGTVTGIDFVNGQMYAVTDRGGLYQVSLFPQFVSGQFFFFSNNLATYVRSSAIDLMTGDNGQPIQFAGLTRGPEDAGGGKYADLLFGITDTGELYAFNTAGELQPIFVNDQTSVDTGLFGVNGLAFSTLDRNLWTVTSNRGTDEGHGTFGGQADQEPFDGSRIQTLGGSSFFFGNDRSTNEGGNQSFSNTGFIRDYNFPGGAHGTLISQPFSLEGYSPDDQPVLYFNYFMETEDTDYDPFVNPIQPTRDTLRVFVSGDDGEWTLVATNDLFQDALRDDEFDIGQNDGLCLHPAFSTEPCVQRLFDNTGTWRQARIPLSRFAGEDNLRLRFDMSTAGAINLGDTFTVGTELRALSGAELRDGQTFTLDFTNTLEFDLGYTLVAPNGAAINDGDSFTINDGIHPITTFEFDNDQQFSHDIAAVPGNQLRDGEQFTISASGVTQLFEFDSGYSLHVPTNGAGLGGIVDGDTFSVDGVTFEFDSDGVFDVAHAIINLVVDTGIQIPLAGGGPGGISDGEQLVINDGQGGPDVVFEFDANNQVVAGSRPVDITNVELHVPIAGGGFGGIQDGDSFAVNDGFGGPDVVFEFDMDNSVVAGNRQIPISSLSSQDEVADAIVSALIASGLGLNPVNRGGGVVRLGVFRHTVDTSNAPTVTDQIIAATRNEIAERLADTILNAGLGLVPTATANGLVRLGSTTHVLSTVNAPSLTERPLFASQDELADLIVTGLIDAGLPITPLNLGGGEVFLGQQVTSLDTGGSARLTQSGAPGVTDPSAAAVVVSPTDTADQVATAIAGAINASALNIIATVNGAIVVLPGNVSFRPNGTALRPANVVAIPFGTDDSPFDVAGSMESALQQAFAAPNLTADLTAEPNDRIVSAVDAGLTGGPADWQADGFIGDNPAFADRPGVDVDVVRLELNGGERIVVDAAALTGSNLQPGIRLFNSEGVELASAGGTTFGFFPGFFGFGFQPAPPQIDFTALSDGIYYVAVSSSSNLDYEPDHAGSANVTLQIPAAGGALGGLTDGETFSIDDGSGAPPTVFEFDANNQVQPGAIAISLNDILLQMPAAGVNPGGIQDGDTFIINDRQGSGDVVFEFDTNFTTSPGSTPVFVNAGDSASAAATSVFIALANANLGLNPTLLGGSSIRLGTVNHLVNTTGTPTIQQVSLPRTQQEIANFTREAIRNADLGLLPAPVFGGAVELDVRDHRIDASLAPNLQVIEPSNTGGYHLTIQVDTTRPLAVYRDGNRLNLQDAGTVTASGLPASFLDGQPGTANPSRVAVPIHSGMTRQEVARAIAGGIGRSTAGYHEQIVAVPGATIADGEIFAISDGQVSQTFEFNSGYSLQLPNPIADPISLLDGEFFTISTGGASTVFEFDNDGVLTMGGAGIRFNDLLLQVPFGGMTFGGINDGDTFAISTGLGVPSTIFEFDTDSITGFGNEVVSVTPTSSQNEVADAIVQSLIAAGIGLSPRNAGQGQVRLGIINHFVDTSGTPGLSRRTVLLSQDELADKVATAIAGAGLGLAPTNLGNGLIHVGGNATHRIDVSGALGMQLFGSPGMTDPSAIEIPLFPGLAVSPSDVSQLIRSAISTARVTKGLNVTATAADARRINLRADDLRTDFSQAPSLPLNIAGDSVKIYDDTVRVIGSDVTNPGPLGMDDSLAGDEFGAFTTSGPPNATRYPGALRGMDNAHEGVYIDDLVIGFAERGEMVTGANVNSTFVPNDELLNLELPVGLVPHNEIHIGPYQLEVRQTEPYGETLQDFTPAILLNRAFDTNDRLVAGQSLDVPAGYLIVEGQTLTLSDGVATVVFEFDDVEIGNGVQQGHIPISYRTSDDQIAVARRLRDAINSAPVQAILGVRAALTDGTDTGLASTSARINLFGAASITVDQNESEQTINEPNDTIAEALVTGIGTSDIATFIGHGEIGDNPAVSPAGLDVDLLQVVMTAGESISIDVDARRIGSTLDPIVAVFDDSGLQLALNDDADGLDSFLTFTAPASGTFYVGVSGFPNFFYDPNVAGSGFTFPGFSSTTGPYTVRISGSSSSFRVIETDSTGDQNITRDQGQVIIRSNRIFRSLEYGVLVDAGARDGGGAAPHQGPVRVTRKLNPSRLVPGVVVENNVIIRSGTGGIRLSADPSAAGGQLAPVPFSRVVNNTIVGQGASGIGIQVDENASPTLLNNILAQLETGIQVDPTAAQTVLGGNLFHTTTTPANGVALSNTAIVLADTDPLFVNVGTGNYYLAAGSRAIDSSLDSLEDRAALVEVRAPLGFAQSPIVAPELDALGQLRVDDPTISTPPGQGEVVFKDRGAIDRADFTGPTAVLMDPRDNDGAGRDKDARVTFVELTNEVVTHFSIQLLDGVEPDDPQEGSGADDTTVRGNRVTVFRDGDRLIQGVDYDFHYDATNNVIRLTPLAGIWEIDHVYEIRLSNGEGLLISAPPGTAVADGDTFDIVDVQGNTATFEFESGYSLHVPQTLTLQIPNIGGAAISDGDTFTISDGITTEVFEFDSNGATIDGNVVIPFTTNDSANEVANQIVTAVAGTSLGLSPVNILNDQGRAVHLGSRSVHTLDTSGTTLTQRGQAAGIEGGQTFTIDDGRRVVTFEFTETGTVGTGIEPITISLNQTHEQIADAIAAAITSAGVGLQPAHEANSDGLVNVGGTPRHIIDASTSQLVVTGQPGVRPEWGLKIPTVAGRPDFTIVQDGQTFVLSDGLGRSETFELDDDGFTTPGNIVIAFDTNQSAAQLAASIALAIRNAQMGLNPISTADGDVILTGTTNHSLDVTNTALVEVGQPGVPSAEPVNFLPGETYRIGVPIRTPIFSESDMAVAIQTAIQRAVASGRLVDVTATLQGGGLSGATEVLLEGAADATGITAILQSDITDIAGNSLKPNRTDGSTAFTIFIGSGLDYGDAPEAYGTLEADNGARHEIVSDFFLGAGVDVDFNGQPTVDATGDDLDGFDDEDGVAIIGELVGGTDGTIEITASADGLLDAWIDYNQDGDWDDPGEQIADSVALTAGINQLTVSVPSDVLQGETVSRFRFSSTGGLSPFGFAADGEVEDHVIPVRGNPWRNPSNALDVNDDGFISPIDALLLINDLNKNGARSLPQIPNPPVPPYLDVNGDISISPLDVLIVIDFLNNRSNGTGEGESALTDNGATAGEGEAGVSPDLWADTNLNSLAGSAIGSTRDFADVPKLAGASVIVVDHRLSDPPDAAGSRNDAADAELLSFTSDVNVVEPAGGEAHDFDSLEQVIDDLAEGLAADSDASIHDLLLGSDDV